jgi:hypothetical protein
MRAMAAETAARSAGSHRDATPAIAAAARNRTGRGNPAAAAAASR